MAGLEIKALRIAKLAHELWCERMIADGWSPGAEYDSQTRVHDALVPFERLGPSDKRSAYLGIVTSDCLGAIEEACDYGRGPERELIADDLRIGMRVFNVGAPEEEGTIEAWDEDGNFPGALQSITVRWDSGEVIEHAAAEKEFRLQTAR